MFGRAVTSRVNQILKKHIGDHVLQGTTTGQYFQHLHMEKKDI